MTDARDGWTYYIGTPPPRGVLCQFRQAVNIYPQPEWIGYREELAPEMNAAYLVWRLTGIGKMQLEAL